MASRMHRALIVMVTQVDLVQRALLRHRVVGLVVIMGARRLLSAGLHWGFEVHEGQVVLVLVTV